jgi:uncharacterized protein HemY
MSPVPPMTTMFVMLDLPRARSDVDQANDVGRHHGASLRLDLGYPGEREAVQALQVQVGLLASGGVHADVAFITPTSNQLKHNAPTVAPTT